MADIRLAKPAAGTTQTVPSAPDGRFIFDFPADAATLTRNGDDLVLTFEDGAAIQLQGFYTTYSKEEMPSFQVDGVEISGQDFFAALDEDLMPAAGPASGSSAARGGRYNEYGGSDLLDGLDHLGRLDIGFDGGTQLATDTVEPSPYSEVDHGVTVTPSGVGAATEVVTVYEAGLAGGSQAGEKDAPTMAGGSLSINAPDGVASIVIGGVVVFENGALTGKVVSTDEGTLSVTGYDPATGKLDFSYRLDRNTTEHVKSDPDTDTQISHTLVVTVTDTDGDSGSTTITVNVVDDAPTAVDDTVIGEEAQAQQGVVGDVLENDKTGADDLPNAVTSVKHDGVEGKGGSALKGAYGELTLHADGTYTYKLDKNVDVEKDTSVTETFTYTIMDADGDTSEATLTITIRGDEKEPVAPGEDKAEIVVDEGALSDGSGQHVVHGISGKDSFTVNLNGEDGTITLKYGTGENSSITLSLINGDPFDETWLSTNTTLTVNGVEVTVTGATQETPGGPWKIEYTYKLTEQQTHDNVGSAGAVGADDALSDSINITVTDATGDMTTGSLMVTVHDDGPVVTDKIDFVTENGDKFFHDTAPTIIFQIGGGAYPDRLEDLKFGADVSAEDEGAPAQIIVKVNGREFSIDVTRGENGQLQFLYGEDGKITFVSDSAEQGEKLTYDKEKGQFTYTRPDGDVGGSADDYTFELTLKDSDGDTVTVISDSITTIPETTIPTVTGSDITVEESALGHGSHPNDGGWKGEGSFTVNLNGEDGSIMLTGDDGKSVTLQIDGGEYVHTGDSTITVNGVQVTVTSAEPNGDGWTVKYNYELTGDQDHNKPGATGADDTLKGMIGITVTDESGDTATDSIMVNVQDDGPVFSEESLTVDVANESEKYWSYGEKIEFTDTEASTLFEGKHIVKMQCEENTLSLYVGKIQFDANGNIDTSNNWNEFIDNQATFHINGEYKEHGIGVHSNYTGGIDFSNSYMWDNRKNEIGYDPISRQSEAVIIELDKPAVNMNIDLSLFFSAAGSDTNPEKAIFLFYKDGEYVGKSHLSSDEASGDVQQNGFSALPPGGFDTVVIAASDNGVDPNRSYDNSEFNISAITFNKFGGVDRTLTGQLDATSADGIKGYSVDTDKLATLELKSGGKPISYGWNEDTGRLLAKAGDATVFELVLNTETGAWTMVQYKEYEGELELPFTATDGDDDSTSISVEIPPTDAKSGTYKVTDSDAEKAVLAAAEQEMKSAVRSGEALATAAVLAGMATVLPDEVPAAEGDRPDTPDETLVAAPAEAADAPAALSFVEEGAALPDSPVEGMDDTPLLFANLALAGQEELMVSAVQTDAADGPLWADASGTDDTSGTVVGETATAGPGAAHPGTAAPEAVLHGTDADDILLGGDGDELIFGGSGDDFIDGGEGRDTIYAGDGNDIIVYDQQDYLVSGGSGIDFMVSDDSTLSLTKLLQGTGDGNGPIVDSIEVLITGKDALSLTSLEQMAKDYGISINGSSLELDSTLWAKADNGYRFTGDLDNDRTPDDLFLQVNSQTDAQVSVELVPSDDIAEAVQRAEIEHSNG